MAAKRSKKKRFKPWKTMLLLSLSIAATLFVYSLFIPNTGAFGVGEYVYVPTGSDYRTVLKVLKENNFVRDVRTFDLLAQRAGYPDKVKAGRFRIEKGMNNYQIIKLLGSGRQEPVNLVITKLRTRQDFVRLVSRKLEADSQELYYLLRDSNFLAQYGLDTHTVMCAVMPNTYQFFWNTSAEKVFRKIAKTYTSFWNEDRKELAHRQGLSPQQVIVLASIVEEETNKRDEKPLVASVYINRIRKGMRLQADPTARYAYGDFTIRRITGMHIAIASPYNTYKVFGLPPGPICTPGEQTISAVLNAPKTDFLYFCAREDFSGYHNFAADLRTHSYNAQKYHQALNQRGIK